MADADDAAVEPVHTFKNHLAIIIGFSDLVLSEMDEHDPRRKDVLEIHRAAHAALKLLPTLVERRK